MKYYKKPEVQKSAVLMLDVVAQSFSVIAQ